MHLLNYLIGLTRPCVEMDVLYWFRMKQTQMYVCTLEEFILENLDALLYKLELRCMDGNPSGLYTITTIEEKG